MQAIIKETTGDGSKIVTIDIPKIGSNEIELVLNKII